jgi:hypothetical protein
MEVFQGRLKSKASSWPNFKISRSYVQQNTLTPWASIAAGQRLSEILLAVVHFAIRG